MQMTTLRVVGIDPGSRVTGIGVVEARGQQLHHVYSDCIRVGDGDLGHRLARIYQGVQEVIEKNIPDEAALEQVFMASNPRAALVLGHARGSAFLAAVHCQLEVTEYSALEIKRAVVGTGRAAKGQVQHMVRVLLGLRQALAVDEADALACAICHIHTAQVRNRLPFQERTG